MDVWTGRVMFEKRWAAVSPQLFTSNGTANGKLTVVDSSVFKVKQQINIASNTLPNLNLEVKSILNDTVILVGPPTANIFTYSDISAYLVADGATISAIEQKRSSVPVEEINRAVYEEEPVVAKRVILVDKHGNKIDENNPLPSTASFTGDVSINTEGYDLNNPDSMNATGSEDGTKTGIKHSLRVDNELDLRVGISDGANKATVSADGKLSVDDANTQALLANVLTQLQSGALSIGTEDGTETGVQHVFVNNLKSMILASHDRNRDVTYLDPTNKKNRRVEKFEFTSATFPGITLVREFNYSLIGNEYVFVNDNWTLI